MKQAGAMTIAQDEATCVVFGMPKEAIKLNGVDKCCLCSRWPARFLHTHAKRGRSRRLDRKREFR